MSMIRASAVVARVARPAIVASQVTVRCMTTSFADRERALEQAYFNREEEKLLRKLLGKVKSQADAKEGAAGGHSAERKALDAIVDKYKVSEEDKKALLAWRHSSEY